MKYVVVLVGLMLMQTGTAQANWMDTLKAKAKSVVDQKVNEAAGNLEHSIENKVNGMQKNSGAGSTADAQTASQTGSSVGNYFATPVAQMQWDQAPEGSTRVRDVVIQGVRLGMPEILMDEALKKEGFERAPGVNQGYHKELHEINGKQVEMSYSDRKNNPGRNFGKTLKSYNFNYMTVPITPEVEADLDEPLKSMVQKARKIRADLEKKAQKALEAEQAGGRRSRVSRYQDKDNILNSPFINTGMGKVRHSPVQLVYRISYTQVYGTGVKFDGKELLAQSRKVFGDPTYGVIGHAKSGSAFGHEGALIYHDAALIPADKKIALIEKTPNKYKNQIHDSFQHPCGGTFNSMLNCAAPSVSGAYPDDLNLQLAAAKIGYAPVMMISVNVGLKTNLSWEYLGAARTIVENFNKKKAYEALPTATADF